MARKSLITQRYCLGFAFVSIQFAFVDGFTAMGMVKEAVPISFFRKGLYILAALLIPRFLPLDNVFYACPLSDCIGATFTLIFYLLVLKKRLRQTMSLRSTNYRKTRN